MSRICCPGFQSLIDNTRNRGCSLFVIDHLGEPIFLVVFRSVDQNIVLDFRSVPSEVGQRLFSYGTQLPISFCPWCGVKLSKYYRTSWKELVSKTLENALDHVPATQVRLDA
jgi:hypothetical protein